MGNSFPGRKGSFSKPGSKSQSLHPDAKVEKDFADRQRELGYARAVINF